MRWCLIAIPILFAACASNGSRDNKHKVEMTLNNIRTDLDDIKHDLNSYEIEHHILEGKLTDQEQTIATLKQQAYDSQEARIEKLTGQVEEVLQSLDKLQKKQKELSVELRQLTAHANDTSSALSQYKDKIERVEKHLSEQDKQFEHILELKTTLSEISSEQLYMPYKIKAGDSLEKIAREFRTTPADLKKINQLANDLIMVGEEIQVPKLPEEE